jgi:trigger factor
MGFPAAAGSHASGPPVARQQLGPVEDARDEVPERAGVEPGGERAQHGLLCIVDRPMASPVSTTVTELPESRVRVQAEVPSAEVERRVAQAARTLGRNLRVPGFRAGKAPPPVIIQRVGRDAVLDEAVRDSIGAWYTAAIDAARIVPVGEPQLDLGDLPQAGEPLKFSIEIGVRPQAELGEYKGLDVPRREPEVSDAEIDEQVEALRERTARLNAVERPARSGDFVVMDYLGKIDGEPFAGGEGRDQMIEVGAGKLIPGFEEQLEGASAGDERTVTVTFPADYTAAELAGREAQFDVTVKEVKEKELPELDEDFAAEAGFDTLDELRADIRERLTEREQAQIEGEFREAALDAAVAAAKVDVPDALVEARSRAQWNELVHSLSHQGATREQIAALKGDEIVEQGKPEAEQALRREAVLAAIVAAEGIAPTDDEVLGEAQPSKKQLARLRESGNLDRLREQLAQQRALELIAESAKPISPERAAAREKLWTPGS